MFERFKQYYYSHADWRFFLVNNIFLCPAILSLAHEKSEVRASRLLIPRSTSESAWALFERFIYYHAHWIFSFNASQETWCWLPCLSHTNIPLVRKSTNEVPLHPLKGYPPRNGSSHDYCTIKRVIHVATVTKMLIINSLRAFLSLGLRVSVIISLSFYYSINGQQEMPASSQCKVTIPLPCGFRTIFALNWVTEIGNICMQNAANNCMSVKPKRSYHFKKLLENVHVSIM